MNAPRFRPSRKCWRLPLAFVLLVVAGFLLSKSSDSDRLDPQRWTPTSGEFDVRQICEDGSVDVLVRLNSKEQIAKVKLLGAELDSEYRGAAVSLLRERLSESPIITLRFDRRRTTEDTGQLQAYFFVGESLLNEELVRIGLATEATHPSDSGPMVRRIKKAEQAAREDQLGVWKN